jgi:hypothetical protein
MILVKQKLVSHLRVLILNSKISIGILDADKVKDKGKVVPVL